MQTANSLEKDHDAGKDWGQEEKGVTEDKMVRWHHQLNEHEFEQASGDSEGHAREAWHTALHGVTNSGTQPSERQHNMGSNNSQFWNFSNCLLIGPGILERQDFVALPGSLVPIQCDQ